MTSSDSLTLHSTNTNNFLCVLNIKSQHEEKPILTRRIISQIEQITLTEAEKGRLVSVCGIVVPVMPVYRLLGDGIVTPLNVIFGPELHYVVPVCSGLAISVVIWWVGIRPCPSNNRKSLIFKNWWNFNSFTVISSMTCVHVTVQVLNQQLLKNVLLTTHFDSVIYINAEYNNCFWKRSQ